MKTIKYKVSLAAAVMFFGGLFVFVGFMSGPVGVAKAQVGYAITISGYYNGQGYPSSPLIGPINTTATGLSYYNTNPFNPNAGGYPLSGGLESYSLTISSSDTVTVNCYPSAITYLNLGGLGSSRSFTGPGTFYPVITSCGTGMVFFQLTTPAAAPVPVNNPPSNLTAVMNPTNVNQMNLSWQNNGSISNIKNYLIERAFVGSSVTSVPSPFTVVGTTNSVTTSYTDDLSQASTPRELIEAIIYRVRALYNDGTYSSYVSSDKSCGSSLTFVYNKLPSELTGTISIPRFMSQLIEDSGSGKSISLIISKLDLVGKDLQNGIVLGMPLLVDPG